MAIYLKKFETQAAYEAAQPNLILPNVSLTVDNNTVHYNPSSPIPPTPTKEGLFIRYNDTEQGFLVDKDGKIVLFSYDFTTTTDPITYEYDNYFSPCPLGDTPYEEWGTVISNIELSISDTVTFEYDGVEYTSIGDGEEYVSFNPLLPTYIE